jgi:hypothetical protein
VGSPVRIPRGQSSSDKVAIERRFTGQGRFMERRLVRLSE